MTSFTPLLATSLTVDQFDAGMLLLRLVIGPVVAFHGFAKLFRGGRLEGTAGWFDSMGMKPGPLHARLAAGGELATGAAITAGLLIPFGGMGLVGLMVVAWWTVHRGNGLLITGSGWEYNLVLGTVGVVFGIFGAGRWSLDNAIGLELTGWPGFIIALAGAAAAAALLGACFRPPAKESQS